MALSGNVYFPGVQVATAADFTLSHGISPSVCLLQTVPQTSYVAEIGTLQLSFGSTLLSFPDCAVRSATLRSSEQGLFWSLQILDRRWKWQFGEIDGRYNVRSADGSIIDSTEKTPRQLAELLLRAMNESQFDVDQIPNDSRPTVVWDAANPADELAQLCDQLSCRIVLGLDNHVRIRPIGDGQTLPFASGEFSYPSLGKRLCLGYLHCLPGNMYITLALVAKQTQMGSAPHENNLEGGKGGREGGDLGYHRNEAG